MRWTIEGADASSGKDVRMQFDAVTEDEARAMARYNGVMVSRIILSEETGPPKLTPPAPPGPPPRLSSRQGLADAIGWVESMAHACTVVAALSLIGGVLCLLGGIGGDMGVTATFIGLGAASIASAIAWLSLAALMRLGAQAAKFLLDRED